MEIGVAAFIGVGPFERLPGDRGRTQAPAGEFLLQGAEGRWRLLSRHEPFRMECAEFDYSSGTTVK